MGHFTTRLPLALRRSLFVLRRRVIQLRLPSRLYPVRAFRIFITPFPRTSIQLSIEGTNRLSQVGTRNVDDGLVTGPARRFYLYNYTRVLVHVEIKIRER